MDHPFWTRKADVQRATDGLSLAADIVTIATLTRDDHAHLLARREDKVSDPNVRDALQRRAWCLGRALETLDELSGVSLADHQREWTQFLSCATTLTDATVSKLEEVRRVLSALQKEASAIEVDDGSSSYSDYSDSRTVSTEDEDEEDEEDED